MSDNPFCRIVLDDAPPHQKLNAMTVSEAEAKNRAECVQAAMAALDEALETWQAEGERFSDSDRAAMHAKVAAHVNHTVDINFEKIRLRLRGQEAVH